MRSSVLSDGAVRSIHKASLAILERTGVHIPHAEMLGRFADSGAKVDMANQRVMIPAALVEKSLQLAGKTFTLYGRDESRQASFGKGSRNYNSIAGEAYWVDSPGTERRFPSLSDVGSAARLGDSLEKLNIVGAMADPHELSPAWRCVEVVAEMIRNTSKPIHFWYHDRASAKWLNEIIIAVRGNRKAAAERPMWYPFLEPISPLRFPLNGIDLLYETAELDMPVSIGPMAQMGISAPMSLAGTMAVENAEILAGICITQLVKPGLPVCYGGICHAFDMRTTQMIFCGPEQAVFGVAMTQMGKHYGLPVYINVGLSDSKRPDAQAGIEAGITLAMGAAAGADIFGHLGICGVDQATSLDMLVLQHEVISYVEHMMKEVDLSDDAFALDLVDEVVKGRTDFIGSDMTLERMRSDLWAPQILDRQFYASWMEEGGLSTEDRCRGRKEELLASHKPEPMPSSLEDSLDQIVKAARKELGKGNG